ncbi:hypothetical protein IQ06DRAFT_330279 [Phaeosphaeriaceae sp. SRC1lsM3a]|nr:hypothetical protein IQ06DRAFT_330279 [Stagonospora sp. SRC1lsM3a]
MKTSLLTFAAFLAPALAAPAPLPQQGPDAWFPDVWTCRCNNSAQDLSIVQPICSSVGGQDLTLDSPHPTLGYLVWRVDQCSKISLKSAQRENRLAGAFNDATCAKQFGAGFVAECKVTGYALCFGEEECQ